MLLAVLCVATEAQTPAIAIIIDDIGYRLRDDRAAAALPGPVAMAILPHSPHAAAMAEQATAAGKEIILHLPMEPERTSMNHSLGPGALMLHMDRVELMRTLNQNLRSVPGAIGVNNHMGSLLTRDTRHMQWLMDSLRLRALFFVDSVTSDRSVAFDMAARKGVPHLRRDVFLDNERDAHNLHSEFTELLRIARRKGSALAIGHPHPETIALLREELPRLAAQGVQLVSVSELLRRHAAIAAQPSGAMAGGMP